MSRQLENNAESEMLSYDSDGNVQKGQDVLTAGGDGKEMEGRKESAKFGQATVGAASGLGALA